MQKVILWIVGEPGIGKTTTRPTGNSMIDDDRLKDLLKDLADSQVTGMWLANDEIQELIQELVKAYQYHKRILPLHQAIAEEWRKLGM